MLQKFWSEEEQKEGKPKKMRANDGAVDSKGRFWVSAVCDPEEASFKPEGIRRLSLFSSPFSLLLPIPFQFFLASLLTVF